MSGCLQHNLEQMAAALGCWLCSMCHPGGAMQALAVCCALALHIDACDNQHGALTSNIAAECVPLSGGELLAGGIRLCAAAGRKGQHYARKEHQASHCVYVRMAQQVDGDVRCVQPG